MAGRPVYVRLTGEQVASVVQAAQAGEKAVDLAAQSSETAFRQAIPPVSVWEQYERAAPEAHGSLALMRGLRLLALLAGGTPVGVVDLAADLKLSVTWASSYLQTLVIVGMVEHDSDTGMYRLAR
ncbi:MAG TPA: helix-turn-helix domain-containing protein [Solirubrobacteraceae bacterium]|jgi:hypothetical protein|nr:helix-turn-helix domain-containing protein [Solirubrobacteraceae bacterium]